MCSRLPHRLQYFAQGCNFLCKFLQTAYILIKITAHITHVVAHVCIKPPGKIQRPTRFTKMNLCSLSTVNLSVHHPSKPKPHAIASRKGLCAPRFTALKLCRFIFVSLMAQETNCPHKHADVFVLVI